MAVLAAVEMMAGTGGPTTRSAIDLGAYRLVAGPIELPGIEDDLSGLTYAPERGTLLAILNAPATIVELSLAGQVLRTVRLEGFDDTEDLAWAGSNRVAVVEERRGNLCLLDLPLDGDRIAYKDVAVWPVAKPNPKNDGLEGVTLDAAGMRYILVKEKKPSIILEVMWVSDRPLLPVGQARPLYDAEDPGPALGDFSAVSWQAPSARLFVLSDESRCVVELTASGKEVARLRLEAGSAGLDADIPQPEGLAFDSEGRLYICSEPNLLYVFERQK